MKTLSFSSFCSIAPLFLLAACNAGAVANSQAASGDGAAKQSSDRPFEVAEIAQFDRPWAMTFVGDTPYALVTEKKGRLILFNTAGNWRLEVGGVPRVDYGGQGGLGDVAIGPDDGSDSAYPVYLSWVEAGPGNSRGAVVGRGTLVIDEMGEGSAEISDLQVIWRQTPKVEGRGHFSHRIAFSPDGQYLFLSSGEREKFDPAQYLSNNLGSILRLNLDGTPAPGNPFADKGGVSREVWSYGHRNALGLAFAPDGRLWEHEMGPKGGDEVNLIVRGENYGYPIKSNGSHYDGRDIPDHAPGDGFKAPEVFWNPVISPAGLIYYTGNMFPEWKNSLLLGGLSGEALIRVTTDGKRARKADQWDMGTRIREVEQGRDGAVWLLEDGDSGKLLKLTPRR